MIINLINNIVCLFDKEDVKRVNNRKWYKNKKGHFETSINNKNISLHRFIYQDYIEKNPKLKIRISRNKNAIHDYRKQTLKLKEKHIKDWTDLEIIFAFQKTENNIFCMELYNKYKPLIDKLVSQSYGKLPLFGLGLEKDDLYSEIFIQFRKAILYINKKKINNRFQFATTIKFFVGSFIGNFWRVYNSKGRKKFFDNTDSLDALILENGFNI